MALGGGGGAPVFAHATIASLFRNTAAHYPRRTALVAGESRLTFAELDERTDRLAAALRMRGIGPGAMVGTLLLNGVAMVELLVATAKLGAVILTMNWRLAPAEIAVILDDARPDFCFASVCFADLARTADAERSWCLVDDDEATSLLDILGITDDVPELPTDTKLVPEDGWYLLYTSGTTGRPKGCLHSQGGYYVNAMTVMGWCGFCESDCCYLSSPLFHVAGLSMFLAWYAAGACSVIQPRQIDLEGILRLTAREGVTVQSIPMLGPSAYLDLQERLRLPMRLRVGIFGGGMHPGDFVARARDTLGLADAVAGYGQSEVGGFISFIRLEDQIERPHSCGRPLPHMDARIVDAEGRVLPPGAHGELQVRSPSVTLGYFNRPDATAEAIEDGWLCTGDVFWQDEDGFLYYAGRIKELVKSGGENVYPAEVELALKTHAAIADCCVVGVPDARWGEAVKAFVVLNEGMTISPSEAADWCRRSIAGYKRPRYIEFIDRIPRDFNGKPQRAMLSSLGVTPDQTAEG
jgi:fatty-acyl-CoA synthase